MPGGRRFVLATANPDKASEIRQIVADAGGGDIELVTRPADVAEVDETGATLEDNALLKARALVGATGLAAVADDTGLEVDALDGAPGVHSSRYASLHATYADNVVKLLRELDRIGAVDPSTRRARFRTVAVAVWPDGTVIAEVGEVTGTIAASAHGAGGFGYDPVFVPDGGDGRTFAELSAAEKHALSHRGAAFRALAARLSQPTA